MSYERPIVQTLRDRLTEPRRFLQVVVGPRQVGKTTAVRQAIESLHIPATYASADGPTLEDAPWIETHWERGRRAAREGGAAVLALDEIQKIEGWSEWVKRLWDEDTAAGLDLRVVLLGSSPLLVGRGLTESLAGRFEVIRAAHWGFAEMEAAFGWDLDRYLHFGGYPGAAPLVEDEERWRRYVQDALIETTVSRDILLMNRVDKPALLRRLFQLACEYSGQILSYQKMLGQLQDAGNTTTLAHYLDLLAGAGLVTTLPKFAGDRARRRGSSPKLQVLNTALMTALAAHRFADVTNDGGFRGRLAESAVGAHLVNGLESTLCEVSYWRDRGYEVDFVLSRGEERLAIEVKSGRAGTAPSGLERFRAAFGHVRTRIVGEGGIPLAEFLRTSPLEWLG